MPSCGARCGPRDEVPGTLHPNNLPRLLAAIVEPLGATWELDHQRGAPPIENDPWAVEQMAAAAELVVGAGSIMATSQSAGGEDFSWYGEVAPLAYLRLGVHRDGAARVGLHASSFDIDEQAVAIGARILAGSAIEALSDLARTDA